jgi:3-hydroxyisobutyrate dehydrogenase-like beta-hydroxyacid dehydrogenase
LTNTIAFLGLGAMGSRMARRLLGRDDAVRVWNRSPGPAEALARDGAVAAATPRAAAEGADVVISMVSDDAAARAVWLDGATGALAAMKAGALAIESSTVTPGWIAELHAAAAARGVDLVDAPVAGSRPQAEAGQLVFIMGGTPEATARAKVIAAPMGGSFPHVGSSGRGARMKLAINLLLGAQIACLAEALGALAADGFDEKQVAELIAGTAVASPAAANYARIMEERREVTMFPVDLMAKDLAYAVEVATARGLSAPIAEAALAAFRAASAAGFGSENVTSLRKIYGGA